MIGPMDVHIDHGGMLIDYLGRGEREFAVALIVRFHQVNNLAEWTPVSRRQLAEFLNTDDMAKSWAANPFWKPSPWELTQHNLVTGWETDPDSLGTVTPLLLELLGERGLWKQRRAQLEPR